MGKKKGESFTYNAPSGPITYKIISIKNRSMASLEEIKEIRLKKLNKLREVGVDPYPAKVSRDFDLIEVK